MFNIKYIKIESILINCILLLILKINIYLIILINYPLNSLIV
jgi:hypothetical protein